MGRDGSGTFHPKRWKPPEYTVDDAGKIVGGYRPQGPHNWGRWGADDNRGTANLIDASAVADAARLIARGAVMSLALPIDDTAPMWSGRKPPKHYFTMTGSDGITGLPHSGEEPGVTFTDDYIDMALQGSTQWDGLAHWAYQDSLYNGYWAGNITSVGSPDLDIAAMKTSFVGRGVLIDVPRHAGRRWLAPSAVVSASLVEETAAAQHVAFRKGDMVLIRTGHLGYWYTLQDDQARRTWYSDAPGLSGDIVPWLHAQDISALAVDTSGVEVFPNERPVDRPYPVHHGALIDLGLTLGELWWLEELAEDCAADGIYEFFLSAPPLNIPGAVGSMLNPIAIK